MSNCHCRKCNRHLKNPLSVKLGIGPVCRAKDSLQREFDFMRAEYEIAKEGDGYIFIRDIGRMRCRSVTNDAEHVVRGLFDNHGISENTRIFYEDSDGRIDELLHVGNVFKGFKAGHEGVEL